MSIEAQPAGAKRDTTTLRVPGTLVILVAVFTIPIWLHFSSIHEWERANFVNGERLIEYRECVSADSSKFATCMKKSSEPTFLHTEKIYDLKAQQDMAKWSLLMLIITAVGVGYIALTLHASHATLDEARKATDAANRTVSETKRIGEAQGRAYVVASGLRAENLTKNATPVFSVTVTNCGSTPAQKVQIRSMVYVSDVDPNSCKIHFEDIGHVSSQVLGPSQHTVGKAYLRAPLSSDLMDLILNEERKLVFAGVISYFDAFGKPRRTVFRAFLDRNQLSNHSAPLTLASRNNRAS